jgi:hypothetical protein
MGTVHEFTSSGYTMTPERRVLLRLSWRPLGLEHPPLRKPGVRRVTRFLRTRVPPPCRSDGPRLAGLLFLQNSSSLPAAREPFSARPWALDAKPSVKTRFSVTQSAALSRSMRQRNAIKAIGTRSHAC